MIIFNDESYPFFLLTLAFIRILGGIVFLDFYHKYKKTRFLALTVAFTLFASTPAIQLTMPHLESLIQYTYNFPPLIPIIFIFSELLTTIGVYLFVIVFFNYFSRINKKHSLLVLGVIIVSVLILYPLLDFRNVFYFTQFLDLVLVLSIIPIIFNYRRPMKEIASNLPLFLMSNVIMAVINIAVTLPIFDFDLIPVLELLTRVGLSFITPFVFIHLEYNLIALEKFRLKDKYSHNLAQLLQIAAVRLYVINKQTVVNDDLQIQLHGLETDHEKINDLLTLIRSI
ncbi:MAG: hypothetical protein ACTSPG_08820 [Candidatus Hodarchaeales archaeon]